MLVYDVRTSSFSHKIFKSVKKRGDRSITSYRVNFLQDIKNMKLITFEEPFLWVILQIPIIFNIYRTLQFEWIGFLLSQFPKMTIMLHLSLTLDQKGRENNWSINKFQICSWIRVLDYGSSPRSTISTIQFVIF